MMRASSFAAALVVSLLAPAAWAETWVAPVGGRPLAIGEGRVACKDAPLDGAAGPRPASSTLEAGWAIEPDGRAVRPPAKDDAVGQPATLRVAATEAACATAPTSVTLVAMGARPQLDALTLDVDAGRALARGKRLRGAVLRWSAAGRTGSDACTQPEKTADGEACAFAIPRDLPADAQEIAVALLPPGARVGPDVVLFDALGKRAADDAYAARVTEIDLARVLPDDATLDLSSGTGHIALAHPEAVAGVTCVDATCDVAGRELVVRGERGSDEKLDVHVQLRPHVVLRAASSGATPDAAPLVVVPIQRCPVSLASAALVAGADEARVVARVEGSCARADGELTVSVAEGPARIERTELVDGALYVVARVPRIEGTADTVTLRRRGTVIGAVRAATHRVAWRPRMELDDGTPLDFIPSNRWAIVRAPSAPRGAAFEVRGVDGAYDARRTAAGLDEVRGADGASGATSLRLALIDRALPPPLGGVVLAESSEPVERAIRPANVAVNIGAAVREATPLVELTCGDGAGRASRVAPSAVASIAYRARDTCQLVFHRERLPTENGAQTLDLSVAVTGADGIARPEARLDRRIVLRHGERPAYLALAGATDPFDRYTVRLTSAGEGLRDAPDEPGRAPPQAQWSVVTGNDHARLYGTAAFPSGLFRLADHGHSGILSLSAGALLRLVALGQDGRAFPLGLEAGVMWLGIAGDTDAAAASHGAIAFVVGPGIAVPLANPGRVTQTAISIHGWLEYEISRDLLGQAGQAVGFVFGPSISIGDVGTNF